MSSILLSRALLLTGTFLPALDTGMDLTSSYPTTGASGFSAKQRKKTPWIGSFQRLDKIYIITPNHSDQFPHFNMKEHHFSFISKIKIKSLRSLDRVQRIFSRQLLMELERT